MTEPIYYFVFGQKSLFIPLKYLYPECGILLEASPQVEPLQCFNTSCPANKNCAEVLVHRTNELFDRHPSTTMLLAYYKNTQGKLRAGVFYKNGDEDPRLISCNPYGFKRLQTLRDDETGQKKSKMYEWRPPVEFYTKRIKTDLIAVPDLLKVT